MDCATVTQHGMIAEMQLYTMKKNSSDDSNCGKWLELLYLHLLGKSLLTRNRQDVKSQVITFLKQNTEESGIMEETKLQMVGVKKSVSKILHIKFNSHTTAFYWINNKLNCGESFRIRPSIFSVHPDVQHHGSPYELYQPVAIRLCR